MLNASRAVQGIGAAIMFACSLAVLSNAFRTAEERAKAFAAYGAAIGASFAVGPLVGGALTSGLDWRFIFLVNLPLGLLCIGITRRFVEESKDPNPRRIDVPGLLTLTAGLFLLVLALLRGNDEGWTSAAILAELGGAVAFLTAFIVVEARVKQPMLPARAVPHQGVHRRADRGLRHLRLVLRRVHLHDAVPAADPRAVRHPGRPRLPAGHDDHAVRVGRHRQPGAEARRGPDGRRRLLLVGIGQALLTVAAVDSSWTVFLPGEIIALIGTGIFNPAVSQLALGSAPPEMSGLAAGVNDTFRQAGIAVGVAALGALVPAAHAFGGDPQTYVDGMRGRAVGRRRPPASPARSACAALLVERRKPATTGELALDAA
jgi:MFS family permease